MGINFTLFSKGKERICPWREDPSAFPLVNPNSKAIQTGDMYTKNATQMVQITIQLKQISPGIGGGNISSMNQTIDITTPAQSTSPAYTGKENNTKEEGESILWEMELDKGELEFNDKKDELNFNDSEKLEGFDNNEHEDLQEFDDNKFGDMEEQHYKISDEGEDLSL
ncbi:hypothetical protein FBU30_008063 [Linnemannia zychae]|nr:hypothetical protein FBU30_008063 [Linnemannia zychae]